VPRRRSILAAPLAPLAPLAAVVLVAAGLAMAARPEPPRLLASQATPAPGSPVAMPAATPTAATANASPVADLAPFVVVDIVGRDYAPKGITIDAGTTVYWVNEDGNAHTATAHDGAFDSGNMSRGAVYDFTFDAPGRYEYGCDYHLDMGGSVTVTR